MTRRDLVALTYLLDTAEPALRTERVIRAKVFAGSGRCPRRLARLRELGLAISEPTGKGTGFGKYRPGPHVWDVTLEGANVSRVARGLPKLTEWKPRLFMEWP